jgi:P-type conjugative transfer protein TrbJ
VFYQPKWWVNNLLTFEMKNQICIKKKYKTLRRGKSMKETRMNSLSAQKSWRLLCIFITILMLFGLFTAPLPARAYTFYCTNCSESMTQMMERVTSLQQLATMMQQYAEAAQQTEQQIEMVQQNIEQYANMLQNTARLPDQIIGQLRGKMTDLAQLTSQLKTQRGDITSMGEIFSQLYPEQSELKGLAGASSREEVEASGAQYRENWDRWSKEVDRAAQATFQLSGQQLDDLQKDSAQFQAYLDDLLSTPTGQMQALMSANQLAAIQIQEARELRSLMATKVQSDLQSQMKAEKQEEMTQELWREAINTDKLKNLKAKPDPF